MLALLVACAEPPAQPPAGDAIRVGWQTSWATQGQIAVILKQTDILAKHGFDASFVGFTYGGPLNEGALAGEVDVLFTADQPALSLFAKDPAWGAVGRLMLNRVGLFVPIESTVQAVADLRGRTVAVPFGAAAHREAIRALRDAGLDPKKDLSFTNLGLEEIVALAGAGVEHGRWGGTDAAAAWDPAFANLEHEGMARTLHVATVTALVMMDDDYVAAHPGADARFRDAVADAWEHFRANREDSHRAWLDATKLSLDLEVLETAAAVEPNWTGDVVRVTLSAGERTGLQGVADFMLDAGLLKRPLQAEAMLRASAR